MAKADQPNSTAEAVASAAESVEAARQGMIAVGLEMKAGHLGLWEHMLLTLNSINARLGALLIHKQIRDPGIDLTPVDFDSIAGEMHNLAKTQIDAIQRAGDGDDGRDIDHSIDEELARLEAEERAQAALEPWARDVGGFDGDCD